MKRFIIAIVFALFGSYLAEAQTFNSPVEYLNYFSKEYNTVAKDQWDYTRTVARGKGARKIEAKRQALIGSTKNAETNIKKMQGYKGSTDLRDSVAAYFTLANIVLTEDYGKIMDMEEVAEQSYDGMEALILARDMASEKLDNANMTVNKAIEAFAKENGITITEDQSQLSKNLEKASEVFDYYNVIYLIFFKSYKQEAYFIDALNRGDVNAMEQNKNALQATTKEGLEKINAQKAFLSDAQLKLACENMLKFYSDEANNGMQTIINFYAKKEAFDKINATMSTKKKKDLTQSDVETYNAASTEYNEAVNEYNKVNETLNADRTKFLNAWNDKSEAFLNRHVPK